MDTMSPKERSRTMARIKSSGNRSTELKVIDLFKKNGIKGWRRKYPAFGKPDFVFTKAKLAVFVDGCFWHACPKHCRMPETNKEYWTKKIGRNKERDKLTAKELRRKGWIVIRIWEHELKSKTKSPKIRRIEKLTKAI